MSCELSWPSSKASIFSFEVCLHIDQGFDTYLVQNADFASEYVPAGHWEHTLDAGQDHVPAAQLLRDENA